MDILALVAQGFSIAKQLVPTAFKLATVRLDPTLGAYNSATDSTPITWGVNLPVDVFPYEDAEERKILPADVRQKTFLLNPNDFAPGQQFHQTGEVELDGETWQIYGVSVAPSGAVAILKGKI